MQSTRKTRAIILLLILTICSMNHKFASYSLAHNSTHFHSLSFCRRMNTYLFSIITLNIPTTSHIITHHMMFYFFHSNLLFHIIMIFPYTLEC